MSAEQKKELFERLYELAREARKKGFSVVFWQPEELSGVDSRLFEMEVVSIGNDLIERSKVSE